MVSTGLTPPLVTCSEPSAMVTPSWPQTRPRVGHGAAGVGAHAAGAGLVLARAGTLRVRPYQRLVVRAPLARSHSSARRPGTRRARRRSARGQRRAGARRACRWVGDGGLERDARGGRGDLLDRPDDELGARVGLAHGVGARLPPGRDHAGAAELRVGLDGDRDELVGEDAAAEDAVVVVAEVGGRDRRAWPDAVLHGLVEDADGAGVDVALEVAADLVVRGPDVADQEQPGGLDRARGDHDVGARTARRRPARASSTPTTRRPCVMSRVAVAPVRRSQRPVASARAIVVLWVPFLASAWQAKPAQVPQRMHAGRPP